MHDTVACQNCLLEDKLLFRCENPECFNQIITLRLTPEFSDSFDFLKIWYHAVTHRIIIPLFINHSEMCKVHH